MRRIYIYPICNIYIEIPSKYIIKVSLCVPEFHHTFVLSSRIRIRLQSIICALTQYPSPHQFPSIIYVYLRQYTNFHRHITPSSNNIIKIPQTWIEHCSAVVLVVGIVVVINDSNREPHTNFCYRRRQMLITHTRLH